MVFYSQWRPEITAGICSFTDAPEIIYIIRLPQTVGPGYMVFMGTNIWQTTMAFWHRPSDEHKIKLQRRDVTFFMVLCVLKLYFMY